MNANKDDESGNDSLALTNLMKKYQISSAQLIELIKNSQLKSSGNKIDASLNTSTSAEQLTERKNSTSLRLSIDTAPMLNATSSSSSLSTSSSSSSSSSSTKSSTLAVNRNDKESKICLAFCVSLKQTNIFVFVILEKKDKPSDDTDGKINDPDDDREDDTGGKAPDQGADKSAKEDQEEESNKKDNQPAADKGKAGLFKFNIFFFSYTQYRR